MSEIKQNIVLLKNNEIDKIKWDACIETASNGLIYAYSFYLDALAENWDALIIDDYKAVMPLPWRKKMGIKYCYHPLLTPQLGLFINTSFTNYTELFNRINKFTSYGDFFLNYANSPLQPALKRANYIIELSQGYNNVYSGYDKALINNLRKARALNLTYSEDTNPGLAIDLYQKHYKKRTAHITGKDYKKYKNLCEYLYQNNKALIRKVTNANNELLAITFLLFDGKRLYNILNIITEEGKVANANHLLLDSVIQEFAGRDIVLDLAGSEIPGVKFFYEKFGPVNQPYFYYHLNNLPFIFKLFKK